MKATFLILCSFILIVVLKEMPLQMLGIVLGSATISLVFLFLGRKMQNGMIAAVFNCVAGVSALTAVVYFFFCERGLGNAASWISFFRLFPLGFS